MDKPMPDISLEPSVIKACSRCRARKVKCDLTVPQCSTCARHEEVCNITEYVAYQYSTVEALLDRIQTLEAQVQATSSIPIQEPADQSPTLSRPVENHEGLSKEAEEIGILAVGGPGSLSAGSYVGSASGSTFARIFFKQISLSPGNLVHASDQDCEGTHHGHTIRQASLPPQPVARQLLEVYVDRIHVWWPFLALPFVQSVLEQIYKEPQQCGDYEKFLVFAVLALGSRSATAFGVRTLDMNTPPSYFQSCLHFFTGFRDTALARKLPSVHAVLLLGLWLMETPEGLGELWHLSRHAMSSAIEAGLHRHNVDWGFEEKEAEIRNRTWWCVYNMERLTAIMTGRVLSIRDHAIEVPLPVYNGALDRITFSSRTNTTAVGVHIQSIEPFRRMIELRRLSGRILESVHVRRHHADAEQLNGFQGGGSVNNGESIVNTSFQQIFAQAEAIGLELTIWEQRLDSLSLHANDFDISGGGVTQDTDDPHMQYIRELRIESSLLQLMLHRPSPVFMVPSTQMVMASERAAKTAIDNWIALDKERAGISAGVCTSVRQLHGILMTGLAALYCDWRTIQAISDQTRLPQGHLWLEKHTQACLGLIERGVSLLGHGPLDKFVGLFRAVMAKIYARKPLDTHRNSALPTGISAPILQDSITMDDRVPFLGEEVDSYLSEVGTMMDEGIFGLDSTLTEWYNALMQGTGAFSPPRDMWN